ncbi:origin recognition complex subunit 4 [Leptopilina heterotoma]|uniref:origin recognition complex subunit 4 n=1 Tax=Leptopilina heterotoma TaxID=63436 RepID=UPI001CA82D11|nr:origin recognition complex subunit 4 [Leptopilina heterotoma]
MNKKGNMAIKFQDSMILQTRKYLKRKIMCPEIKYRHHEKERQYVLDLLKRTVETGESNSALLIGPEDTGKTILVNSVLRELSISKNFKDNCVIVNLHGLVHTDDRLALKDATRQMQLETAVGEKVFGSFAENLSFLLDCLKSGDKKRSKPIIFILDEFDLFCEHNNQTLLYNLFDVAQSAQAPICVLGITNRLDVLELLEKRVKSRFSSRQIFLLPDDNKIDLECGTNEKPFDDRLLLFKNLLCLPDDENVNGIEHEFDDCYIDATFANSWNESIAKIAKNQILINLLKSMYKNDTSERKFRNFLVIAITYLTENHQKLEIDDFVEASKVYLQDDRVAILKGLSVLEMCLIIAMYKETELCKDEPLNFEHVYNCYNLFAAQSSSIHSVQRPVIVKAFEHIKNLEILQPIGSSNSRVEKEYQFYKFILTPQQVLDAVKNYANLPTEVHQWAVNTYTAR